MKLVGHVVTLAVLALPLFGASNAGATLCSARNGTLFRRDQCFPTEKSVTTFSVCAKRSGKLIPRATCKDSESLATELRGPMCAKRSGKLFQREECRSKETRLDWGSLCGRHSGKLELREDCRQRDTFMGAVSLYPIAPTALNTGSTGSLSFWCDGGVCECHGTEDCNDMFSTNVCDGSWSMCCDAGYPETCRCGDPEWCVTRAYPVSTAEHETADHEFSKPGFGGYRLDWCESWGTGCGEPAADRFCQRHYGSEANAVYFAIEADIGLRSPTKTQVDGKVCAEGFCDGFYSITCRAPATAVYIPDLIGTFPNLGGVILK